MEYYVYQLIDPRTGKIFYIGKGHKKRMYAHVKDVQRERIPNGSNVYLGRKIKKILNEKLKVKYKKIFTTENEQEEYDKEKELIVERGLTNLCNIMFGGLGGMLGQTHSEETKQKMRLSASKDTSMTKTSEAIENWKQSRKGYRHSEETKKKLAKANTGQISWNKGKTGIYSIETLKKMSDVKKGKTFTDEHKENLSNAMKGRPAWNKGKTYTLKIYSLEELTKICSGCGSIQQYNSKKTLMNSKRKQTICKRCANTGNRNPSAKKKKFNGEV